MDNTQFKQTKFDSMVTNRQMQLMKAVIPYINNPIGNYIGAYIKLQEFQNSFKFNLPTTFSTMNTDKPVSDNFMKNILNDVRDFLSPDERDSIDNLMMIMELFKSMGDMNGDFMQEFMSSMNISDDFMNDFMDGLHNNFDGGIDNE